MPPLSATEAIVTPAPPLSPALPARSLSPPRRRCQSPSSSPRRGALPRDSQLLSILRLLFASDNCSLFLTHPQPPPRTPPPPPPPLLPALGTV